MIKSQKYAILGSWFGMLGATMGCTAWILLNTFLLKDWNLFIEVSLLDAGALILSLILLLKYPARTFSLLGAILFFVLLVAATQSAILLDKTPLAEMPYPADVTSLRQIQHLFLLMSILPIGFILADVFGLGKRRDFS